MMIISLLLILLSDTYIWYVFLHHAPVAWSIVHWIPTSVLVAAMIAFRANVSQWSMSTIAVILLCIALPKVLFTVVSLTGRAAALIQPSASGWFDTAGAVVAATVCLACLYGVVSGWKRLIVNRVEIVSDDLPLSFDGYRIVQLTDLHLGTFGDNTRYMRRLVERIERMSPDLIVFTGDLVNLSADELEPFGEVLSRLRARDGVVSVLGNHDYCLYKHYDDEHGAARDTECVKQFEREAGWRLLLNEHVDIVRGADTIAVIGVENVGRPPFPSQGDLRRAMNGVTDHRFKVLLSHDPTHWRDEVVPSTDIQLTLSGHTHGMQLKIGGFSPSSWIYPEWGGLYTEGGQLLFVSTGAGGNLPFRLGAWPEIVEITLRSGRR